MAEKPFFARYLSRTEMAALSNETQGGGKGATSSSGLVAITLKAGKCGNDCDTDDPDKN